MTAISVLRNYIPILLVMVFWGSMGIPSTYAVAEYSPMAVLCLRSGIAALFLFPIVRKRHGRILPASEDRILLILLSVIGVLACNYFYFFAVQNTSLTHVAVLYALGPIITTIQASIFLKEPIHSGRLWGIVFAFTGVCLLMTGGRISEFLRGGFHIGDCAELLSALCLAVYTILSKRIKKTPADCAAFWLMLFCFMMTLPLVFALEGGFASHVSLRCTVSVCYLGIACSGLGYLLQQKSIHQIGASASAAFLNGISPITILTAALVMGERISPLQICCIVLVFFGLFLNAGDFRLSALAGVKSPKRR